MIIMRNFRAAATLFLETVSTFTSTELMSYTSFVGLTVLVCIISLERTQLRDKVSTKQQTVSSCQFLLFSAIF